MGAKNALRIAASSQSSAETWTVNRKAEKDFQISFRILERHCTTVKGGDVKAPPQPCH
jgi:hypothetical protein